MKRQNICKVLCRVSSVGGIIYFCKTDVLCRGRTPFDFQSDAPFVFVGTRIARPFLFGVAFVGDQWSAGNATPRNKIFV